MGQEREYFYNKAKREVPSRWYEKSPVTYTLGLAAGMVGSSYTYHEFVAQDRPMYHVAGAVIGLIGIIADRTSTIKGFEAVEEAVKIGIREPRQMEANPLGTKLQSAREYKRSIPLAVTDVGLVAVSAWLPAIGAPTAAAKVLVSFSNRRIAKRWNRAIEMAREEKSA